MVIAKWLESLPTSKLDFVEMGFDALAVDLIAQLDSHKKEIKEQYS